MGVAGCDRSAGVEDDGAEDVLARPAGAAICHRERGPAARLSGGREYRRGRGAAPVRTVCSVAVRRRGFAGALGCCCGENPRWLVSSDLPVACPRCIEEESRSVRAVRVDAPYRLCALLAPFRRSSRMVNTDVMSNVLNVSAPLSVYTSSRNLRVDQAVKFS
jgi:hypothetical protein